LRIIFLDYKKSVRPLVMENITTDCLYKLKIKDIENLRIRRGNRLFSLKKFFKIEEEKEDYNNLIEDFKLVLRNSDISLKWLGFKMSGGTFKVEGDAGMHLGAKMTGGEIIVEGDVDNWCGAEIEGGQINIKNNAGDFLGSNYIGNMIGMIGGKIIVNGSAGDFVGARLSGGIINIKGDVGNFLGYYMLKGEITVEGYYGEPIGARMKGGIIKLLKPLEKTPMGFKFLRKIEQDNGIYEKSFSIYMGDLVESGKGEILIKN
jgi:formylmethanofuran dehydrogenase subunit C